MSSTALQHWKGDRSARLDELVKAHAQVGGTGRGRRWRRRVKMRSEHLDRLNEARNAIAHDEPEKIARLTADGYPLNLRTFWQWRKALNGLAATMDNVLSEYLATSFRTTRPW